MLIAISSKYSANGSGRSISSASRQGKICSEAGEMPSPRRGRPEGSPAWSAQRRGTLGFRRAEAVSPRSGRSTPARFAEPFPKLPVPGVDHPLRGFAFSDAVPRVPPRNKRSASPWATIGRPHPRAERSQRKAKRQSRRSRRHIVAHSVSCGFVQRRSKARECGRHR